MGFKKVVGLRKKVLRYFYRNNLSNIYNFSRKKVVKFVKINVFWVSFIYLILFIHSFFFRVGIFILHICTMYKIELYSVHPMNGVVCAVLSCFNFIELGAVN